jgi:hypothetical protein
MMRAPNVIISTNLQLRIDGQPASGQSQPSDPAVAVYFDLPKLKGRAIACDTYTRVECNMWAIAMAIDGLRRVDRYHVGQGDEQFVGYAALPEPTSSKQWWQVLGFASPNVSENEIQSAWRSLAFEAHPDRGGSDARMAEINVAREQGFEALKTMAK